MNLTAIDPASDLTTITLSPHTTPQTWVIPRATPPIILDALRDGSYEADLLRTLTRVQLQSDDRVVEAGTGIGYVTSYLSRQVACVVTYETHPLLRAAATINVARHGALAPNTRLCHGALVPDVVVSSGYDTTPVTLRAEWWHSSLAELPPPPFATDRTETDRTPRARRTQYTHRAPASGLHQRLRQHDATVLIVSVEGAEYALLEPLAGRLPTSVRLLVVEWHGFHAQQRIIPCLKHLLERQGFALLYDDYGDAPSAAPGYTRVTALERLER